MDRRDALKALTALAGTAGLSVAAVTAVDAQAADLIILKANDPISKEQVNEIGKSWRAGVKGTALEHCPVAVLSDGIEILLVKRPS